jgi:hypothetical protein
MALSQRRDAGASLGAYHNHPQQHNKSTPEASNHLLKELTDIIGEIEKEGNEKIQALTRQLRKKVEEKLNGGVLEKVARTCDKILQHVRENQSGTSATNATRRWADVVASPQAAQPRPTIRARIDNTKDKTPTEILDLVRPAIPQAIAIHKLHSGDVEIRLATQTQRDAVAKAADPQGVRILRKAFLVEVPGVPYTFPVNNNKSADNTEAIRAIEKTL